MSRRSRSCKPNRREGARGGPVLVHQYGPPTAPPAASPVEERPKPQKRPRPKPAPPAQPPVSQPWQIAPEPAASGSGVFPSGVSFPSPSLTDESVVPTIEYDRPASPPRTPAPQVAPSVTAWPTPAPEPSILPPVVTRTDPLLEISAAGPRIAEREELPRRNDVAMPRTVVVLWSFFVLLALIAAFGAGLLAGHFVWK